jgi:beta-glucosidase
MALVSVPDLARPDLSGLPAGFVWGAATAAFPIEGDVGQRGASIWDRWCAEPGRIADGSAPGVGCDHVHRYQQDVELMRDLGIDGYRFSISWPRVQPAGRGPLSGAGMGFYDRLVDALLAAGIQPWVTQYHWDLPVELQDAGGWAARDVVDRFADYAVGLHAALGDRVSCWATLDEPSSSAWLGYGSGVHAPGIRDHALAARAAHHLLLAHGRAMAGMRAQAPADHRLGIVLNLFPIRPDEAVPAASLTHLCDVARRMDGIQNRWWLDALFTGGYPPDTLDLLAPHLNGVIAPDDLAEIAQPLDFLGVTYQSDLLIVPADPPAADDTGSYPGAGTVRPADPEPGAPGRPATPDGLRRMLLRVGSEYPAAPALVVTGKGLAGQDPPPALLEAEATGAPVADPARVEYLLRQLGAVARASREGADVRGYFVWSLLDGFEWQHGYSQPSGLIRVDRETQRRTPRASFASYRDLLAARRPERRSGPGEG